MKPCPFCGATDSEENACQQAGVVTRAFKSPAGGMAYRVECCCGASGPAMAGMLAAEGAWDRRSDTNGVRSDD